jgi:hypothetical protein
MNVLSFDKQIAIIAALTEGCSIRAVERLTGAHRDTIMRLGLKLGIGCARLHDRSMHSLRVGRIEIVRSTASWGSGSGVVPRPRWSRRTGATNTSSRR